MLSPRILHYTKNQIFWQCLSLNACESAPAGLPESVNQISETELKWRSALHRGKMEGDKHLSDTERADLQLDVSWKVAVRNYSGCNLSFTKDKLMALAGIANVMRKASGERYLAGLWGPASVDQGWRSNIVDQLGWRVVNGAKADGEPSKRYAEPCAPSWSWASVDGQISLASRLPQQRDYQAQVLLASTTLVPEGTETGQVLADECTIRLKGNLVDLAFQKSRNHGGRLDWRPNLPVSGAVWCFAWLDEGIELQAGQQYFDFPVMLLACTQNRAPMTPEGISGHGILLRPSPAGTDHFTRAGMMEFSGLTDQAWQILSGHRAFDQRQNPASGEAGLKLGAVITLI